LLLRASRIFDPFAALSGPGLRVPPLADGSSTPLWTGADLIHLPPVDRRLAHKNLRTALIAGAIALIVFALSFVVGLVY
jgi:hypothetical protein